jgi:hypothetical protein
MDSSIAMLIERSAAIQAESILRWGIARVNETNREFKSNDGQEQA